MNMTNPVAPISTKEQAMVKKLRQQARINRSAKMRQKNLNKLYNSSVAPPKFGSKKSNGTETMKKN